MDALNDLVERVRTPQKPPKNCKDALEDPANHSTMLYKALADPLPCKLARDNHHSNRIKGEKTQVSC